MFTGVRHFYPRRFGWLVALLALAVLARASGADAPWTNQYSLREWHVQDGLPSEDVTRVHVDRAGYLWLATASGVARFDGAYFERYESEFKALGIVPYVSTFTETEELGLVFASTAGGLVALRDGKFSRMEVVRDRVVNSLFAADDGALWGSCDDNTLFRLKAGQIEIYAPEIKGPHRLVARFATDAEGRLWIAGGSFIGRYEKGRVTVLNDEFGGVDFRVADSSSGGIWVLTAEKLFKIDEHGMQVVLPRLPPLANAHYVSALLEDRHGTLWLGTRSQGLYAVVNGECRMVPTSGEGIVSLCEDRDGDVWIASNGGGLNRLRFRDFQLFDRTAGLGDNFSYTVCEDEHGVVWFGNRDGGVARLRHGRVEVLSWPNWPLFAATSVMPDRNGQIWVTNGMGVFKIDPQAGDSFTRVEAFPKRPTVRVAFTARNGDYWFAFDPERVGRFRDGKSELFGASEGYNAKQTRVITEDAQGRILVGTSDGQMLRFEDGRFTRILLDAKGEPGISIQDIFVERDTGILWIGTAGNGLYVLKDGKCREVTVADGLLDPTITAIIPDDQGYLWFGSSSGVFSLRRQELDEFLAGKVRRVHPVIVGRDDGMHGLTCLGLYKPSAWKGRDGRLWFATRKGVLNFDPRRAITDVATPPVIVAAAKIDDERRPLVAGAPLQISARVRKLELRLSVLALSAPDRVQIKYRLDGFDSAWVTAGPDRLVTYPRLPPGNYQFRAMASFGNNVWNDTGPGLALTVVPRWWQTMWFQLAAAVSLVAFVVLIVRTVSHRRLRSRLERLEQESAIERERARIARNIHDDLGASLTRVSLLTQMPRRDGATPEAPQLTQIYETVRQITRSLDEIVWAVNPKNDHLDGLATYLVSYAQSFLSVAGIRCRLDLPSQLPAATLTSQTRHNVYLCVKEALNNVVKHSGADEVTIAMSVEGSRFTLSVADNGRRLSRLENPHVAAQRELRVSSGHGLTNIALRVAEMGGVHEFVPPADGQGARLTISLELRAPERITLTFLGKN